MTSSSTNYAHGHTAEKVAARYLRQQGYKIYALNWRHPRAEIDIVAGRPASADGSGSDEPVFVEVKYRQTTHQGAGLDYITPRKLGQMRFAAELWMERHNYRGECTLAAIELAGPDYEVTDFLPDIS